MTPTMPIPHHQHHHRAVSRRHGSSWNLPFPLLLFLLLSLCSEAQAQPSGSNSQNPNGNLRGGFGPAMGIIVVIMVSAFLFMVFFSIYLRQCSERGDSSVGPGRAEGRVRSRRLAARGLDPSVVQAFPTLVYAEVKEHKIGKGTLECAVCLSEYEDDETLRLLPKCDHVFHTDCIDVWLSSHTTCPVCRSNLDPNAPAAAEATAPAGSPADVGTSAAAVGVEEETQREAQERAPGRQRPDDHVAIVIEEPEAGDLRMRRTESKSRLRWRWSRSMARPPPRFSRSHSTGHSPRSGEDCERYTLRLPDHIRRDVMAGKFQRSSSFAAADGNSTRKGHRAGGEGSSRGAGGPVGGRSFKLRRWEWASKSDRWAFFTRTFSMVVTRGDDGAGEGSAPRGEGSSRKGAEGTGAGAGAGAGGATAAGEGSVKGKKVFPAAYA